MTLFSLKVYIVGNFHQCYRNNVGYKSDNFNENIRYGNSSSEILKFK